MRCKSEPLARHVPHASQLLKGSLWSLSKGIHTKACIKLPKMTPRPVRAARTLFGEKTVETGLVVSGSAAVRGIVSA